MTMDVVDRFLAGLKAKWATTGDTDALYLDPLGLTETDFPFAEPDDD